jgi:predicted RNA-binding protein with PIN domain
MAEHARPSPSREGGADEASGEDAAPALPSVDLWLVDGFNVLHAIVLGGEPRGRFWDGEHRGRLIAQLARGLASGTPIVVVFDGRRPVDGDAAHPADGVELVFAPSADDWMVRRARSAGDERVGVVTRDRKVAGRCRHAGAEVVEPGPFMAALRRA